MITLEDKSKLKLMINGKTLKQQKTQLRWEERERDEKGRFKANESSLVIEEVSQLKSDRDIKIVKVKGSYNSYLIKTVWLTESDADFLIVIGTFIILAVFF